MGSNVSPPVRPESRQKGKKLRNTPFVLHDDLTSLETIAEEREYLVVSESYPAFGSVQ